MLEENKEKIVTIEEDKHINIHLFVRVLLLSVLAISIVLIAVSIWSNHFLYFGDKGRFSGYNDRLSKVEYLKTIPKNELAQAYILGSSDMLPFQPQELEEKVGLKTFNCANFWGRNEEIAGWIQFLTEDLKNPPQYVFIGIEPWTFSDDKSGPIFLETLRPRFIVTKELAKYSPQYSRWRYELSRFCTIFSRLNLEILIRASLEYGFERQPRKSFLDSPLALDGTFKPYNERNPSPFFPEEVTQFYDHQPEGVTTQEKEKIRKKLLDLQHIRLGDIQRRLPGDKMSKEDMRIFEDLMAYCQDNNIKVGMVILPVHPYFRDQLNRHTNYSKHIETLMNFLNDLQAKYPTIHRVMNVSDVSAFSGKARDFRDENHMTPKNTKRIIDTFFSTNGQPQ